MTLTDHEGVNAVAAANSSASSELTGETDPRVLMRQLIRLREFDLACEQWWHAGEPLVGEFHLSLGQEGFTIGTCAGLDVADLVCPSIRGMGVYLYRGVPMVQLIASFYEREGSISGGRWPHWHSPYLDVGVLPQTGMLGAGLVMAAGVALSQKTMQTGKIVCAMLGDGATNTGYFHEGLNFAAVKHLPIVIVVENNQIAVSTSIGDAVLIENLSERAKAYGILGETVDGCDILAVRDVVSRAARRAREGAGPTLIELKAYRWGGQTLKDPDRNRSDEEKARYQRHCPIDRLKSALIAQGVLTEAAFQSMVTEARQEIAQAYESAQALPKLDPAPYKDAPRMLPAYAID